MQMLLTETITIQWKMYTGHRYVNENLAWFSENEILTTPVSLVKPQKMREILLNTALVMSCKEFFMTNESKRRYYRIIFQDTDNFSTARNTSIAADIFDFRTVYSCRLNSF